MVAQRGQILPSRELTQKLSPEDVKNTRTVGIRDVTWACLAVLYRIGLNLFPLSAHMRLAVLRGFVHRKIFGIPRHVLENLTDAFEEMGQNEIHEIARRHVEFSGETNLERILPLLYRFQHSKGWRIEGESYLQSALEEGRGVLLLTAHFGYARLIEPVLKFRGYDAVRVVAKTSRGGLNRSQRWDQWVQKHGILGQRFADLFLFDLLRSDNIAAQLDIRPILRALSQKKLLVVAGDGLVSIDFIKMNFLDRQYPFATGYIKIAMLTGAPIVPVFAGVDANEIVIEVLPPIERGMGSTLENTLHECVTILENQVKLKPHLWARWRNRKLWQTVSAWAEKNPEERFLRHNPWSRE